MAVSLVISVVGLFADQRLVTGELAWHKPLKFAISNGLYGITLAWMLSLFPRWKRTLWWMGTFIAGALLLETVLITYQAARGTKSHFNLSSPLDANILLAMGVGSVVLWGVTLVIGFLLMRQRLIDRPLAWTIRIGVLLAVAGMTYGFVMVTPTPDQAAVMEATGHSPYIGAHSVGVPDGQSALPVTGWNEVGGDLRVPHFVGIHALQVLPLLAIALQAMAARYALLREQSTRTRLVVAVSLGYAGVLAVVSWQAFRGQALFALDGSTVSAVGVVVVATLIAVLAILGKAKGGAEQDRSDDEDKAPSVTA
ncbi:hypothetical protein [Saccharopolyspora taberi]|uniref:Uncharacterized protein n=1 Tax=Saccharopolyspora taberi TaxID=60895 RepID=A0ABN3VAD9_9PSEU